MLNEESVEGKITLSDIKGALEKDGVLNTWAISPILFVVDTSKYNAGVSNLEMDKFRKLMARLDDEDVGKSHIIED